MAIFLSLSKATDSSSVNPTSGGDSGLSQSSSVERLDGAGEAVADSVVELDVPALLLHLERGDSPKEEMLRVLQDSHCRHKIDLDGMSAILGEAIHEHSPNIYPVLRACAEILLEVPVTASPVDMHHWGHAAAYLFRGIFDEGTAASLLDNREDRSLAHRVFESMVERSICSTTLGSSPLILRALLIHNLSEMSRLESISKFPFRPRILARPQFIAMLKAVSSEVDESPSDSLRGAPISAVSNFVSSNNPKDFFGWIMDHTVTLPRERAVVGLFPILEREFGDRAVTYISKYRSVREGGESLTSGTANPDRALANLRKGVQVREVVPGYFFDLFGTLLDKEGNPNFRLIHWLEELHQRHREKKGPEAVIISDSELNGSQGAILEKLGIKDNSIPVRRKEDLIGLRLALLVDDNIPEVQGLRARTYIKPDSAPAYFSGEIAALNALAA